MEQFFQQLINGLMIGSTYAVVALGFGLIFSSTVFPGNSELPFI
jgi:branched-subunit amino acid ABC-type transport system permease component